MAFRYTIDPQRRLARVTVAGSVGAPEVTDIILALLQDEQWQPGYDVVCDCREVTELILEARDPRAFVKLIADRADRAGAGRDVIIVNRSVDYAMAKVYAAFAQMGPRPAYVCCLESEAEAILDRSPQ
jgi:hypothetical protein